MNILDPQLWRLIEPYLDQALALAPEQVGIWLDDLERTKPQIARTVRELLAELAMLDAIGFLAVPLVETKIARLMLVELLRENNPSRSLESESIDYKS